jgi:isochorismate synthase
MNPYVLADWTTKQNIAELVEAGTAKAQRLSRPVLVSLTERVEWQAATRFFAEAQVQGKEAFLWTHPDQQFALAGVGVAHRIETQGDSRFRDTATAWQALLDDAIVDGLDTLAGSGPTLVGGFGFDPLRPRTDRWQGFTDGSFVLPRYQLTTHRDAALLTENLVVGGLSNPQEISNGSDWRVARPRATQAYSDSARLGEYEDVPPASPSRNGHHPLGDHKSRPYGIESLLPPDTWKAIVAQATQDIQAGDYEKIVLARGVQVTADQAFDLYAVLTALQQAYPWAYTFAITRGTKTFLGATPERLVGVSGGIVRATALAGTARRGATPEEDAQVGADLMASPKNRHEHDVVVQMLRAALSDPCVDIHAADTPTLLKLANVQHLYTPVSGRLRPHSTLMDLISRLHPTPAVGGLPSQKAVGYIRDYEGLDRGWYAAPVGWLDARKEGDFAVALRSGLVEGNTATLFAGCGIVADSDPAAELTESELKLQPMLKALAERRA